MKAPVWMSDEDCKNCGNCGITFSMTRRKHHCRGCGKVAFLYFLTLTRLAKRKNLLILSDWREIAVARNAQVTASLLTKSCCLAVIKPIPGCARIACSGLMMTSLLQVFKRLYASSFIDKTFIRKLDASCWKNLC